MNVTLFGNSHCRCNQAQIRIGPKSNDWLFIKERRGMFEQGDIEETFGGRPCDDRGREWSEAATIQGLPSTAINQKEVRKDSFLEISEGTWHCKHLDFGLWASRPMRKYISVVLSH